MPGLNLNVMGGVGMGASPPASTIAPTATEAAFGPGYTQPGTPSSVGSFLIPNDPAGVTFWLGISALALLLVVRHSLPN